MYADMTMPIIRTNIYGKPPKDVTRLARFTSNHFKSLKTNSKSENINVKKLAIALKKFEINLAVLLTAFTTLVIKTPPKILQE